MSVKGLGWVGGMGQGKGGRSRWWSLFGEDEMILLIYI